MRLIGGYYKTPGLFGVTFDKFLCRPQRQVLSVRCFSAIPMTAPKKLKRKRSRRCFMTFSYNPHTVTKWLKVMR